MSKSIMETMAELKSQQAVINQKMAVAAAGIEQSRQSSASNFKNLVLDNKVKFDELLLDTDSTVIGFFNTDFMSEADLKAADKKIADLKKAISADEIKDSQSHFDLINQVRSIEDALNQPRYRIVIDRFTETPVRARSKGSTSKPASAKKQVEINGVWESFSSWTAACDKLKLTIKNQSGKTVLTTAGHKVREVTS